MTTPMIKGALQAVSILTNTWQQSMRFYREGLGYQLLADGELSQIQKEIFGKHLSKFALLGHKEGSVVRLIESSLSNALPLRYNCRPWDNGLAVFEAGTPDIERAYYKLLRARFGATTYPIEFAAEGPEPLGYVVMKSAGFIGPAGEQIFVTQIVRRKGGESLLKESAVDGINTPANVVISMKDRSPIDQFWDKLMGIHPVNDLYLKQKEAAIIMGGPLDMGFDMLLMGQGKERIGMEQHVYGPYNPNFTYPVIPCSFEKTGLVSACWQGTDLKEAEKRISEAGFRILSTTGLPLRHLSEPKSLVFVGPLGEIIELVE